MSFEESSSPSSTFDVESADANVVSIDVANLTPSLLPGVAVVGERLPRIPRTIIVSSTIHSPAVRIVVIIVVVVVAIRVVTIAPLASCGG